METFWVQSECEFGIPSKCPFFGSLFSFLFSPLLYQCFYLTHGYLPILLSFFLFFLSFFVSFPRLVFSYILLHFLALQMMTTLPANYPACHQCQDRLHHALPILQNDNNGILLLRSELGQLREQLNKKNRQLEQQQLDMHQLNSKYVAALDQVATIQHEKDLAERELEDLTSRLFEQANMMVATEKREVYRLRTELSRRQSQAELEQTKYKQLVRDLQQQHSDMKSPSFLLSFPPSSLYSPLSLGPMLMPGDDMLTMDLAYDQQHIQLFQQFIQAFAAKPTLSQHKQQPFMKECLIGDVEPCLNFGPGNRLQSVKKMVDSMMQQTCVIEEMHSASAPPVSPTYHPDLDSITTTAPTSVASAVSSSIGLRWNRFVSGTSSLVDCAGCGNTLNMQHYYRFRLADGCAGETDWLHLDELCRDRLKAVCTFFVFMRQLANHITTPPTDHDQQTTTTHSEEGQPTLMRQPPLMTTTDGPCPLYLEMTRFRLAMFYARLGIKRSCWSADDDATSTTSTQGPMTPVSSLSRQISNKA